MAFEHVVYEVKDLVARITINRPEARNAMNRQTMRELTEALYAAEGDPAVGVVVLTASGEKAFCAGADVKMFREMVKQPDETLAMVDQFVRMVSAVRECGKPVIARVNGIAIGGALELLVAADLLIAAEHATFMPGESGVGATPYGGSTQGLALSIGDHRARWLLYTDEAISAKTAMEWGFVNRVVPFSELDAEVERVCRTLLNKSPWALRGAKTQANVWWDLVSSSMHQGKDFWVLQSLLPDILKSVSSFLEEKKPFDWVAFRREAAGGRAQEFFWGAPTTTCGHCGAKFLPQDTKFCGNCGQPLDGGTANAD